jgi:hypothetical protein
MQFTAAAGFLTKLYSLLYYYVYKVNKKEEEQKGLLKVKVNTTTHH